MPRIRRIIFDITPQTHNKVIDGPRIGVFVQPPHFFQNLFTGNHAAIVAYEMAQKLRLHQREMNHVALGAQFQRAEINGLARERESPKVAEIAEIRSRFSTRGL